MKIYLTAIVLVILSSCKKGDETSVITLSPVIDNSINFPDSVYYGKNILAMPDCTMLVANKHYSFGVILGNDAELKLKVTNYSLTAPQSATPVWYYAENRAWWLVSDYDFVNNIQTFRAIDKGKIDLECFFSGSPGICKVDFYENSSSVTKTKYLKW